MALDIQTVPCLEDNYAYILRDAETGKVAVVDAPEAGPLIEALEARGLGLDLLLITHHHPDHIDGTAELRAKYGCEVWGGKADAHRLPPLDRALEEGDDIAVGASTGKVLDVSGHTVGHIAFHFAGSDAVFSADSLMAMGCGRLFEGDGPMMQTTMEKFLNMPDSTIVYSGHEYTQSNMKFALTIESQNADMLARATRIDSARERGQPTVPSSLAEEKATNPFLRAHVQSVKDAVGLPDGSDAEVFTEVRRRKDNF
ncbi:hydroxyacylglutathione hydrolase [Pontivivens insulae]|uniref:Hydroxyacylglutathione hydrolase n=1 Tax=Pontivivens insulae TaxID=1639689 RepID=A0A2R8A8H5_9RHOB|nr:hydroxyacylglutathione hydrolase [Pontivivens insulae]RED18639.1 hydroxyacylglutathione hydrolase [Pontivivens insulae]SPF28537.1 Hydroxyacylglutathione hydrolase GloB [Pontivivens insulae]